MRKQTPLIALVVIVAVIGCDSVSDLPIVTGEAARSTTGATELSEADPWATSDDDALSLQIIVRPGRIEAGAPIHVVAQLRNESGRTLAVLRPFGDPFAAEADGLKLWGPKGQLKYSGDKPSYILGDGVIVMLKAEEIIEDELDLPVMNHAGSDRPGKYYIRFDYSYNGEFDDRAARNGFGSPWRGVICSRNIPFQKVKNGKL